MLQPGLALPARPEIILPDARLLIPAASRILRHPLKRWRDRTARDTLVAAAAIDQGNIGTAAVSTGLSSANLVTTAAVASGGLIVLLVGRFNSSGGTLSVSGGSLTWVQGHTVLSGSLRLSIFLAYAPAGLASVTTLTATNSAASNDFTMCAASYTGFPSTFTVAAFNGVAAATAAFSSSSVAAAAGDALIGGAYGDGTLRTSTPTSPAVERVDFNSATTGGSVTLIDKLSVAGTDTLDGTWSGTLNHIGAAVAITPSAGGGGVTVKNLASLGVG